MSNKKILKISISAILLSIGLVLPFITMQIPTIGVMLSPMHIPVLIAGYTVGPWFSLIIGIILPILRGILFMMPKFPSAFFMAVELGTYGLASGLLFDKVCKHKYTYKNIYITLISSMLLGRIAYGIVKLFAYRYLLNMQAYTFGLWLSDVYLRSIPGIILHLILIPVLIMMLYKRGDLK